MPTDPNASFAFLYERDPGSKPETVSGGASLTSNGSPTLDYHPTHDEQRSVARPTAFPTLPGYTILKELGRGGMGVVYLARQEQLHRLVALKMILGGTRADDVSMRRFRAEAEIVAQLRHPNIVQIYDMGECDGHAYFTMELLPGGALLKRQREQPLVPREAAAMIRTLALALQAVHDKGILHRDMKPANVLLQIEERRGHHGHPPADTPLNQSSLIHWDSAIPKITDFGLAKRIQAEGMTQTGMLMGTPEYMAPEQAKGDAAQLGPGVDIYALGAMLYEFLVGRPPFRGFSPLETVMQVMAQEPIPPSRLQPGTPRDLETICLKCLEKDPTRRYPSARELAEELQRYLDGVPILARPAGALERAAKWARRKPAWAALAATVVLAMVLLSVGVVLLFNANAEESRQRQRAEDNAVRAEENATRAAAAQKFAEEKERQARENYRTAQEAVDKLFVQVMDTELLKAEAMREVRKLLLRESLPLCERLLQQQGDDPQVLLSVARNHLRIGTIIRETEQNDAARPHFESALQIAERLEAANPELILAKDAKAMALNYLGELHHTLGLNPAAAEYFRRASLVYQLLIVAQPRQPHHRLGLVMVRNNLAILHKEEGRFTEAEAQYRQALDDLAPLLAAQPQASNYRAMQALLLINLGRVEERLKHGSQALASLEQSAKQYRSLVEQEKHVAKHREGLANVCMALGQLQQAGKDFPHALRNLQEALRLRQQLAEAFPTVVAYQQQLAESWNNLGLLYLQTAKYPQAETALKEAHDRYRQLVKEQPGVLHYRLHLGATCNNLGNAARRQGHDADALPWFTEAEKSFEGLLAQSPRHQDARTFLRNVCANRAQTLEKLARPADAARDWARALVLDEGAFRRQFHVQRLRALAKTDDATARRALAALEQPQDWPALEVYDLARCQAIRWATLTDRTQQDQWAAQVLNSLQQAREAGFFTTSAGRQEFQEELARDFAPWRQRPEFQQLLQRMAEEKPKAP